MCESDIDAAIIITQNWLHAPQVIQALTAGKHVYSAVQAGISVEEITDLVKAVEETGNIYMIGETSYYYPSVLYCREQYKKGAFGRIVYGEAEYYHDWDHGLYDIFKARGGDRWLETAGSPPMHYPTHSTSQIISVTGARMTHVSCQGFVDRADDRIYRTDTNKWGNVFSNQSALLKMSDGSLCRINEFRRVGHPGGERLSLFGTEASFEMNSAGSIWVTKDHEKSTRLDDLFECKGIVHTDSSGDHAQGMELLPRHDSYFYDVSAIHPIERLPKQFQGLPNGHRGSHQFLVDDFVKACVSGKIPPNNVWDAARYMMPGLIAHESSLKNGELMEILILGTLHHFKIKFSSGKGGINNGIISTSVNDGS